LTGFFSVRAAGQRYRVIFRIDEAHPKVTVYLVGIRKGGSRNDVYNLALRLVRRGLM
jgi:mRNA interferase RelE/StbE